MSVSPPYCRKGDRIALLAPAGRFPAEKLAMAEEQVIAVLFSSEAPLSRESRPNETIKTLTKLMSCSSLDFRTITHKTQHTKGTQHEHTEESIVKKKKLLYFSQ